NKSGTESIGTRCTFDCRAIGRSTRAASMRSIARRLSGDGHSNYGLGGNISSARSFDILFCLRKGGVFLGRGLVWVEHTKRSKSKWQQGNPQHRKGAVD